MVDIERLKNYFHKDCFARNRVGISIAEADGCGYAKCQLKIEPYHLNAGGAVQGGVFFTLADFAFAVAANACGHVTVTLSTQMEFMHTATGDMLYAAAKKISSTRRICFYEVEVTDTTGTLVSKAHIQGYIKDEPVNFG